MHGQQLCDPKIPNTQMGFKLSFLLDCQFSFFNFLFPTVKMLIKVKIYPPPNAYFGFWVCLWNLHVEMKKEEKWQRGGIFIWIQPVSLSKSTKHYYTIKKQSCLNIAETSHELLIVLLLIYRKVNLFQSFQSHVRKWLHQNNTALACAF